MCLIIFAKNKHPKYKLIIAANRDEFFSRSTLVADFWEEDRSILGGRDVQSGGTWFGINKNGRFIAITNYRDPKNEKKEAKSRGELSKKFLSQNLNVSDFLADVSKDRYKYNGFNLLLSDDNFENLYHYSNVTDVSMKIDDGIHGLSNHLLDSPWPKIQKGKKSLKSILQSDSINSAEIFTMLKNGTEAPDNSLPGTGISYDLEKKLSPVFISLKGYGTRCSTALIVDASGQLSFQEISYNEHKQVISEKKYKLPLMP
jgi:uncharacterized protein with NRDE domain